MADKKENPKGDSSEGKKNASAKKGSSKLRRAKPLDEAKSSESKSTRANQSKPRQSEPKAGKPASKPKRDKRVAKAKAVASALSEEGLEEERPERSFISGLWHDSPSWLSSLIIHAVVLLLLAKWLLPSPPPLPQPGLRFAGEDSQTEMPEQMNEPEDAPDVDLNELPDTIQPETMNVEDEVELSNFDELENAAALVQESEFGSDISPDTIMDNADGGTGSELSGRGKKARSALVRGGGGGDDTENAVALALDWLIHHQRSNGSWSFAHNRGECQGRCPNPGSLVNADNGATALAILPFLGAGQTHREGKYKKQVKGGIAHLVRSMKITRDGGSLSEPGGTMYSHGLGAIALCEAYAMTGDRKLAAPAQQSLNYIMSVQDPNGGGWRYQPREPGDTSAVGWQIMALKSGHMAYLNVNSNTIKGASRFLDSVQTDYGSGYGYMTPGNRNSTTAVGLLCRMYLGWKKENSALARGVGRLDKAGPSEDNVYYDYYATQVMFQFTGARGEVWNRWNTKMKTFLVNKQAKKGHAKGSWFFGRALGAKRGGRLYTTAMSTMILEVYYRHMPIFKENATTEDFPE